MEDCARSEIDSCLLLGDAAVLKPSHLAGLLRAPIALRRRALICGVTGAKRRARLLKAGIGDLAAAHEGLTEISLRGARVLDRLALGPVRLEVGVLRLDLFDRSASVAGKRLVLHPREFTLLWRLAQDAGSDVSQADLLADVWRIAARPETNSLAVHVSRTRAKLRIAGLDGLLVSTPRGYRLDLATQPASALDVKARIGEEGRRSKQEGFHARRVQAQ